MDLSTPQVMGILNVTPDSFYAGSRAQTEAEIVKRCHEIVEQGASMIDVGGYSTRPGGTEVSEAEEMERATGRGRRRAIGAGGDLSPYGRHRQC